MEKRAIFAGSFDPFTAGHYDIVIRALAIFDHITVAVGFNIKKSGLMPIKRRVDLVRDVFANDPRVDVVSYQGFTTDLCHKLGVKVLVRGIRSVDDFEGDRTIDAVNKRLAPEIETIYLFTHPMLGAISSAVVKEVIAHGGNPAQFMPEGIDINKYLLSHDLP